jgi:N-acylethanolamine-hydrolysing acid amidase
MAGALGVSTNGLLMAQYINELSAFCTSVVAYQADGTIFHGRNLDFLFETTMRNITFQGEFYKNGTLLYTAVMYAGLNGVPTGWRDEFSISINNRKPSNRTSATDLLENIGLIFMGYSQNMKLIRDTLQECSTYDCAFKKLTYTPQIAPSYFAIAGSKNKQGAVITKDRMGPAHIDLLTPDNWYVAQTNDDHWTGVCTIRCQYVRESMDAIGRDNITPEKLRNILLQWPSNNEHSIYNALMIPS